MTNLTRRMREKIEDWKARRRGEVRIAPPGATGRVYARRADIEPAARAPQQAGFVAKVPTEPKVTLRMKITRANGEIEHRVEGGTVVKIPRNLGGNDSG